MKIKFQKYHGCGNDFLICEYNENIDYEALTKKICNRYIGIGADTLITIDYKHVLLFLMEKIQFYYLHYKFREST